MKNPTHPRLRPSKYSAVTSSKFGQPKSRTLVFPFIRLYPRSFLFFASADLKVFKF